MTEIPSGGGGRQTTRHDRDATRFPTLPHMITELALSPGHSVSLRKQLAAQIGAAIRSGELDTGRRLPSGRRLAELLGLHRHTVHAAYADLARLGLVHQRRRSGVFVRPGAASGSSCRRDVGSLSLETEFAEFLRVQRCTGRSAAELNRLMSRWAERSFERGIGVVEPEPALRRLIAAEIAAELPDVEVTGSGWCRARRRPDALRGRCLVARHEVATGFRGFDPALADLIVLRTTCVRECRAAVRALHAGQVATLLTSSRLLRRYARELLAGDLGGSVGLACPRPERRSDLDRALRISTLVLADLNTSLPDTSSVPAFAFQPVRVVDRRWLRNLARYIGVGPRRWKNAPAAELERLRGIG
ncbi:MAG: winged helix-turn-helix domain-containing protein [Gemmatimonadales bacterium]